MVERRAEDDVVKQGMRQFGYYPLLDDRTRWKFASSEKN